MSGTTSNPGSVQFHIWWRDPGTGEFVLKDALARADGSSPASAAPFDPDRELERLQKEYGDAVIVLSEKERTKRWKRKAWATAARAASGLLLLGFGQLLFQLGLLAMHVSDDVEKGKGDIPALIAKARSERFEAIDARDNASKNLRTVEQGMPRVLARVPLLFRSQPPAGIFGGLSDELQDYVRRVRTARIELAFWQAVLPQKDAQLCGAWDGYRARLFGATRFGQPDSSSRLMTERAVGIFGPIGIVAGVLLMIGALVVPMSGWARRRAATFAETLVNGVAAATPKASLPLAAAASGPAGGLPWRALPLGTAPLLTRIPAGDFALRTSVVAAAALISIGAFRVTIPDQSFTVRSSIPDTVAEVTMGKFKIHVPEQEFQIKPENVRLADGQPPSSSVDSPQISFRLPPVTLNQDAAATAALAAALSSYRQFLETQTTTQSTIDQLRRERADLATQNLVLFQRLGDYPSRKEIDALSALVRNESNARLAAETAMQKLTEASNKQQLGRELDALQLARQINGENDRVFTSLFRQNIVRQNCEVYDALSVVFPKFIAKNGCIHRSRIGSIDPRKQTAPRLVRDDVRLNPTPQSELATAHTEGPTTELLASDTPRNRR